MVRYGVVLISESVIKQFLSRELSSHDWLKEYDRSAISRIVSEYGHNPDSLWLHQQISLLLMEEYPRFLLYLDPGGGKTRITLEFIKRKGCKALVFVPYMSAITVWVDEAAKWTSTLKCLSLMGSTDENRYKLGHNDADVVVGCYVSVVACLKDRVAHTDGGEWVLNSSSMAQAFPNYDALILDEIHKCGNHKTLTYEMCRWIAKRVKYCYGLTGTPFGGDLQVLWPQYNLIDWGATLGPNISFYREVFFKRTQNHWGGFEYKLRKRLIKPLKRFIKNRSIRFSVQEYADLPPKQYISRHIRQPLNAEEQVKKAKRELNQGLKDKKREVVKNTLIRLQQLSSGFVTFKSDDSRVEVEFDDNPKLDATVEIVSSVPEGEKVVIFHHFIYSNKLISQALDKAGVGNARVWGGQRDPASELKKFKDSPKCKSLVINVQSGSSSLNLQFASYVIFFEQPITPTDRIQAEARLWRQGQTNKVMIYDLFVDGCLDDAKFKSNMDGRDFIEDLLSGRQEVSKDKLS